MITSIKDVPTNIPVTVYTGCMRCKGCGLLIYNAEYVARATDDYADIGDGRVRRRFNFEGDNPFCDCDDHIWLSSDDLPYIVDGWPVAEKVSVEQTNDNCDIVD